jgi:hypothetical protein
MLFACRTVLAGLLLGAVYGSSSVAQTKHAIRPAARFDTGDAMASLFGNFDSKTGASQANISQATADRLKDQNFESGAEIFVRPLRVIEAKEDGRQKFILLTYSVPKVTWNFDCHACRPYIGEAVFVRDGQRWNVESSGDMITEAGGFGHPPHGFRVVQLGPRRIGLEMINGDGGQGETTILNALFVPWNGKVNEALHFFAHDDDLGGCVEIPCYSNHRTISFVSGANGDYFDIFLALSGTDMTDQIPYRRKPVHGVERFAFSHGFYKSQSRTGDTTSLERSVQEEQSIQSAH